MVEAGLKSIGKGKNAVMAGEWGNMSNTSLSAQYAELCQRLGVCMRKHHFSLLQTHQTQWVTDHLSARATLQDGEVMNEKVCCTLGSGKGKCVESGECTSPFP